jgi:hypothetical protein
MDQSNGANGSSSGKSYEAARAIVHVPCPGFIQVIFRTVHTYACAFCGHGARKLMYNFFHFAGVTSNCTLAPDKHQELYIRSRK